MAAKRIDGTVQNGLVFEQGGCFQCSFTCYAAAPSFNYAKFEVREHRTSTDVLLSITNSSSYLNLINKTDHCDIFINVPNSITANVPDVGRNSLYYELEIAESTSNIHKVAFGLIPWRAELGGL